MVSSVCFQGVVDAPLVEEFAFFSAGPGRVKAGFGLSFWCGV